MKKNEKSFLINVMWVPCFTGIMTAALSKAPNANPFIVAIFMGIVGAAMCYLDYVVFIKKSSQNNSESK